MDLAFHGFLSSPHPIKIRTISQYLENQGHSVDSVTAVNLYPTRPDFEQMTPSDLIEPVTTAFQPLAPRILNGSSHGGLIAICVTFSRSDMVDWQVLLAPALFYYGNLCNRYDLERWRDEKYMRINFPPFGGEIKPGFQYVRDLKTYKQPVPVMINPTLIIHDTADQLTPLSDTGEYEQIVDGDLLTVHQIERGDHQLSNVMSQVNKLISNGLGGVN